jgi:hypothetical protein
MIFYVIGTIAHLHDFCIFYYKIKLPNFCAFYSILFAISVYSPNFQRGPKETGNARIGPKDCVLTSGV